MSKADILAVKEASCLLRTDGKRPDGVTLIPWKDGRCVTWDVTVTDMMAQSYLAVTSQTSGAAAEAAADRKAAQVCPIDTSIFVHGVAAEAIGAINGNSIEFLDDLGRRITQVTDDNREKAFLVNDCR